MKAILRKHSVTTLLGNKECKKGLCGAVRPSLRAIWAIRCLQAKWSSFFIQLKHLIKKKHPHKIYSEESNVTGQNGTTPFVDLRVGYLRTSSLYFVCSVVIKIDCQERNFEMKGMEFTFLEISLSVMETWCEQFVSCLRKLSLSRRTDPGIVQPTNMSTHFTIRIFRKVK